MDVKSYKAKFKGHVLQVATMAERRLPFISCNLERKDAWNPEPKAAYCHDKDGNPETSGWPCQCSCDTRPPSVCSGWQTTVMSSIMPLKV